MLLDHLSILNFKNIPEADLPFVAGLNCIVGDNGMGKSNLLDAIYCLSIGRSLTGVPDTMLLRQGADLGVVRGQYTRDGQPELLALGLWADRRKGLKRGGKEVRLSQHLGQFPLVASVPRDEELVRGSAEERRRWTDLLLSQTDPVYLDALIHYGRAMEQRNGMLRDGMTDRLLYESVETTLARTGSYIVTRRYALADSLREILGRVYPAIAGDDAEMPSLAYAGPENPTPETMMARLEAARRHDEAVRHTSVGPHRDDMEFTLAGMPMRRTASQGQAKTFTLGLRLAQYEFLRDRAAVRPLLLLDDIFDKLDTGRVTRIMKLVTGGDYGQCFITDTNSHHLDDILGESRLPHRLWHADRGSFTLLTP